jgi:hypothetical protein
MIVTLCLLVCTAHDIVLCSLSHSRRCRTRQCSWYLHSQTVPRVITASRVSMRALCMVHFCVLFRVDTQHDTFEHNVTGEVVLENSVLALSLNAHGLARTLCRCALVVRVHVVMQYVCCCPQQARQRLCRIESAFNQIHQSGVGYVVMLATFASDYHQAPISCARTLA